uniref:Uncharacterized protein n=1 Tax=uncultured marine virus TaxID=186617 RepID=A0A0F7L4X7_9VIRU|nr:hypothetical protein APCd_gp85 [uncultured marine virus]
MHVTGLLGGNILLFSSHQVQLENIKWQLRRRSFNRPRKKTSCIGTSSNGQIPHTPRNSTPAGLREQISMQRIVCDISRSDLDRLVKDLASISGNQSSTVKVTLEPSLFQLLCGGWKMALNTQHRNITVELSFTSQPKAK